MKCPDCGSKTKVIVTVEKDRKRYRVCLICQTRFTTVELINEDSIRRPAHSFMVRK